MPIVKIAVDSGGVRIKMSQSNTPQYAAPSDARRMMEYDARKKSIAVAYLLWFFLGWLGGHRFYLERTGSAIAMLLVTLISLFTMFFFIGLLGLFVIGIWALVDAFLIPGWLRDYNLRIMNTIG
jgi:TM2 domain-containing membrane protein YozV